jgi:hypothetical protein
MALVTIRQTKSVLDLLNRARHPDEPWDPPVKAPRGFSYETALLDHQLARTVAGAQSQRVGTDMLLIRSVIRVRPRPKSAWRKSTIPT